MANKIRILLDPGHSKNYNKGVYPGYYESNVMYDYSHILKNALEATGIFEVFNTKYKLDMSPSLYERGRMAIEKGCRVLLSLHSNAVSDSTVSGTMTFYSVNRKNNNTFAIGLDSEIAETFKKVGVSTARTRKWYEQTLSDGQDYYGVIRHSVSEYCVQYANLIEHAFHTNYSDCEGLATTKIMEEVAKTTAWYLYETLLKYYIPDDATFVTDISKYTYNVRADGDSNAQIVGYVKENETYEVQAKTKDSNWYRILHHGCAAYVSSNINPELLVKVPFEDDTSTPEPPPEPTPQPSVYPVEFDTTQSDYPGKVNTVYGLNVRSGPDTSYNILDTLVDGTDVTIRPTKNLLGDWYCIYYPIEDFYSYGFVSKSYITPEYAEYKAARVTASVGLNYRVGPSTSEKKIGALPYGTTVYATPYSLDPNWNKIKLNYQDTEIYYASAQYLTYVYTDTNKPVVDQTTEESPNTLIQIGSSESGVSLINVRSAPEANANVAWTVPIMTFALSNKKYDLNGVIWYRVIIDNLIGYIKGTYVTEINPPTFNTSNLKGAYIEVDIGGVVEQDCDEWFKYTANAVRYKDVDLAYDYNSNRGVFIIEQNADVPENERLIIVSPVDGVVVANTIVATGREVTILSFDNTYHKFSHLRPTTDESIPSVGDFIYVGYVIGNGSILPSAYFKGDDSIPVDTYGFGYEVYTRHSLDSSVVCKHIPSRHYIYNHTICAKNRIKTPYETD